jgi:hypothetical protein
LLLAVVLCASGVSGDEHRVNVRTTGSQANPALALTEAGDVIAVWSSYYSSSGRSNEIVGRRWNLSDMPPDADEFQVNVARAGNDTEPAVAVDGQGRFVVAWQGPGLDAEDVFLRQFDPNGRALTDDTRVNSYTPGRQLYPRVAANGAGAFVVVWESCGPAGEEQRSLICTRRFDPNAAALGESSVVDQDQTDCRYPDIAMDANGGFAVTWLQDRTSKTIFARLFDPNGTAVTSAFEVSQVGCSSLTRPSVAMDAAGRFVITWDGDPNRAADDDIHARLYDPDGTAQTDPFVVNDLRAGAQQWPRAAASANEFVIVWTHDTNEPDAATDIHARRFDWSGRPAADSFPVNTTAAGKQQYPAVAMHSDATLVVLWEAEEPDNGGYDVYAKVVPPAVVPDFDADGRVTFFDFAVLALHWREQIASRPIDLTRDGNVDITDLMALCRYWLRE